jgi:hypothetical protein
LLNISFEESNIKMMDRFSGLSPASVNSFNLVFHMPVVIALGQLGRGAVRRPPDLRTKLIALLARPLVA